MNEKPWNEFRSQIMRQLTETGHRARVAISVIAAQAGHSDPLLRDLDEGVNSVDELMRLGPRLTVETGLGYELVPTSAAMDVARIHQARTTARAAAAELQMKTIPGGQIALAMLKRETES